VSRFFTNTFIAMLFSNPAPGFYLSSWKLPGFCIVPWCNGERFLIFD